MGSLLVGSSLPNQWLLALETLRAVFHALPALAILSWGRTAENQVSVFALTISGGHTPDRGVKVILT
jgi:hypothetical protein